MAQRGLPMQSLYIIYLQVCKYGIHPWMSTTGLTLGVGLLTGQPNDRTT